MGQWASKQNERLQASEFTEEVSADTQRLLREEQRRGTDAPQPVEMTELRTDDFRHMPPDFALQPREERWEMVPNDVWRLPPVDLDRYTGLWYAGLATPMCCFNPACMSNATAEYEADPGGQELHILNKGTCLPGCLCQARAVGVPVSHQANGGQSLRLEEGPRDFHVYFCINRDWQDAACAGLCCRAGSYQILHVGYLSSDGQHIVQAPLRSASPLVMQYSSGIDGQEVSSAAPGPVTPYDFAVVGTSSRDQAWLLLRQPMRPDSPFHDRHELYKILRPFGYPASIMTELHYVHHTNPQAWMGKNYVRCCTGC